jgi:hypothetical protein
MKKALLIGGTLGIALIIFVWLRLAAQRKVSQGLEYDLSPAGEIFNIGQQQNDSSAPRYAVDSRVSPAADLVAMYIDTFQKSENTMTEIRQRIGYNSNLFAGINTDARTKIGQAFVAKFGINPASLLSYPTWTTDKSPGLLPRLKSKALIQWGQFRPGSSQLTEFYTVPEWGINFANIGLDPAEPETFYSIKKFYANAAAEIERLQDQTRYEAVQYLRRQGWRFTDYGDINAA